MQETKFILHNHNYDTVEKAKLSGDMSEPQLPDAGKGGKRQTSQEPRKPHSYYVCSSVRILTSIYLERAQTLF